jgi:hypothetical protein
LPYYRCLNKSKVLKIGRGSVNLSAKVKQMTGIISQFIVLDLCIEKMAASRDPELIAITNALKANSAFAHLGATGGDLLDFMPNDFARGRLGAQAAVPTSGLLSSALPAVRQAHQAFSPRLAA